MVAAGRNVLILAVVLAASAAEAAPRLWSTTTPLDTWTDTSAQIAPSIAEQVRTIEGMGGTMQLASYMKDGAMLQMISLQVPLPPDPRQITEYEGAARESTKYGTELSYKRTPGTKTSVIDAVYEDADSEKVFIRRSTGFIGGKLSSVHVTCLAAGDACTSLIASIVVDESAFRPLADLGERDSEPGIVDEKSDAYRYGSIAGIATLVLIIGVWFWRNYKPG